MALISLLQAKDHLRITDDDHNADIALKLSVAEQMILDRCNTTAHWRAITPTWTSATVPGGVRNAIFLVLTHLYENRGDDMTVDADFWAAVDRVISLHRDPVIA